jgi:hypothetical protein
MSRLEQYVVETPDGQVFRVYASNKFDAGRQVRVLIARANSLVKQVHSLSVNNKIA